MVLPGPGRRRGRRGRDYRGAFQCAVLTEEQAPEDVGEVGSNADAAGVSRRVVVLPRRKSSAL